MIGNYQGQIYSMFNSRVILRLSSLLVLLVSPQRVSAQNVSDVISLFQGLAQTAIAQSTLIEWQKLPKGELACLDRALLSQGESVRALVQQGIQPTDRRISDLRATCLNKSPERVVSGDRPSVYVVDGLPLGAKVNPNSSSYGEYRCQPSEQFVGFTWCQKQKTNIGPKGRFEVNGSILHSADDTAVYVNQYIRPAFFSGSDFSDQIDRLSKKFGQAPVILEMPHRPGLQRAIIASWGNILLEKLGESDIATLASGVSPKLGLLIDFLGDFQKSARTGLPVFRLAGADGYVWSASYDATGRGHLRFLEANVQQIAKRSGTADAVIGSRPSDKSIKQPDPSPLLESNRQSNSPADASDEAKTEAPAFLEIGNAQSEVEKQTTRQVESKRDIVQESQRETAVPRTKFGGIQSLVNWIGSSMMSVSEIKEAFSSCQSTLLEAENDVLAKIDIAIQKETSRVRQQQFIILRDQAESVKLTHARAGCLKRLLIPIMLDMNGMGQNTQGNQRCCGDMDQLVLMDGAFLIERLRSRLADLTDVGLGQYLAKLSLSDQKPEIVLIGNGDTKNCFMTKTFAAPNMFGNYGSMTGGMSCHGKLEDALVETAKEIP